MAPLHLDYKCYEGRKILITGGAGFIGSHLVEALLAYGAEVIVLDNLSSGSLENLEQAFNYENFTFIKGDLLKIEDLENSVEDCYMVYHLAANPEVRISSINPEIHYEQNILATYNLLEALRKKGDVEVLIFTSSSTVYGEPSWIPTPEDYAPLKPISVYGASKLACEALISAYAHTYGFKAIIYRLANIVGPRSKHGVVYDFIQKLRKNPRELEILGDGRQKKSYLYIDDCIKAMLIGTARSRELVEVFNVGSEDQIDVKRIAEIVIEEMGLKDVELKFTGGVDGGRGWIGDVKNMLLDISKLKLRGWRPRYNSEQAIRVTVKNTFKSRLDIYP
ncbi:MAG: NAD-dependent epimerase/dehydratase family protein [Nitrososphaerota archaeon]